MKTYPIRDVTGDRYLNPAPPATRPVGNVQKIIVHHDAVVRPHNYDTMARLRSEARQLTTNNAICSDRIYPTNSS